MTSSPLDHLVGARQQCLWNRNTHRLSGLEVDHQLELGRLFDRDVGDLSAAEELDELSAHKLSKDLNEARSVASKAAFLRHFGPLIDGWQAQRCGAVHDKLTIAQKSGDAKTLSAVAPDACAISMAAAISSPLAIR